MTNWHTLVRYLCDCGNTHPDELSAKLCAEHDKALSIADRAKIIVDNQQRKSTMAQPPGKTRAMPTRAKKKPTTTAAKKRKNKTKKA